MPDDEMTDPARRHAADRLGGGDYGPGAVEDVVLPPSDERREAQERDIQDPADVAVDPDVLRDGGPTRTQGVATTTGGTAGPASVRRRPRHPEGKRPGRKVAPTTTGDATTGGMRTPPRGSTSDQSSGASQVGNVTDR